MQSGAVSLACLASWVALVSLEAGWLPFARHAWAYNLWQYFPPWVSVLLGAATLALASSRARQALIAGTARFSSLARASGASGSGWRAAFGAWALLSLGLWLVRDRQLLGDANILIWQAASGMRFLFPDVGATFLMGALVRAVRALGFGHPGVVAALQLALCASGALALLCVWRAGRYLAPGHGAGAALLILSGGLLRVFAGHVEVYGFLLAAAGAYLWSALAHLAGRSSWTSPCLALGVAAWLHPSALALLPSLVLLLRGTALPRPARRILLGLGLASLPWLLFLPVMLATADRATLDHAREVFLQVLGLRHDAGAPHRWVRGWGGAPSVGTDYVFLAPAHLKYLVNAFHLLCAWALPALLLLAVRRRSLLFATPTARFLAVASLPLVGYALVLRPVWGPFDWDLFSLTALFLAALSAHLLAGALADLPFRHVLIWLVGFNLLFCGVPLLVIGFAPIRARGPFVPEAFDTAILDPSSAAFARIAPWL
ncbi:MAG: hypothetical protein ACREI8_10925 [Myxococcota bacterium]